MNYSKLGSLLVDNVYFSDRMIMERLHAIFPGWETVRCIGTGSSGRVYEIKKKDEYGGDFHSALKVMSVPSTQKEYDEMKETMSEFEMRTRLREKVEEISNEYRLMGTLKGHPNIVSCEDQMIVPNEDGLGWSIYIRMELLESLTDYIRENGMSVGDIIKLGVDICSALELCRSNGIIHRDIKPQNIFVGKYGGYKLGDFGVAKSMSRGYSSDLAGTYSYMAPEVYKGKSYDDRVDIYSLGMVLYHLLNDNRGPFLPTDRTPTQSEIGEGQFKRFIGEELPLPKNGNAVLKEIVVKACAYDSADRFDNPTEMKKALLSALNYRKAGTVSPAAGDDMTVKEEFPRRMPERPLEPAPLPRIPRTGSTARPVEVKSPTPPVAAAPKKTDEDKKEGNSSAAIIIILSIIVLSLAAVIMFFVLFDKDDDNKTPQPTPTPTESVEPSKAPEVSSLVLSSPRLVLTESESARLTVTCIPEPKEGDPLPTIIWRSSNEEIASVDSDGNVTAMKEGTATIMVCVKDKMEIYDECDVTVERPTVKKLVIEQMPIKTAYSLGEEINTEGLILKAYYNNNTEKTVSDPYEYTVECDMSTIGSKSVRVSYDGATVEYTIWISVF